MTCFLGSWSKVPHIKCCDECSDCNSSDKDCYFSHVLPPSQRDEPGGHKNCTYNQVKKNNPKKTRVWVDVPIYSIKKKRYDQHPDPAHAEAPSKNCSSLWIIKTFKVSSYGSTNPVPLHRQQSLLHFPLSANLGSLQ